MRVTSAGWYYLRYLTKAFAYLDLVLQDTPVDDYPVHEELRQSVRDVDNMRDREELKLARVRTRFARVEVFLEYLNDEEEKEREAYDLRQEMGPVGYQIIPRIQSQYEREKGWIERRLMENREHIDEVVPFDDLDDEATELLREYVELDEEET